MHELTGHADVTVITAVYNCKDYLEECVVSVQEQTLPPREHILVDDRSSDDGYDLAVKLAAELTRVPIRVLRHAENLGFPSALNTGITAAASGFVGILDADDAALPAWLEAASPIITGDGGLGALGTAVQLIDEEGRGLLVSSVSPSALDATEAHARGHLYGWHSGLLIRRSALDEVGGYDVRMRTGQDSDLKARLAQSYAVRYIPQPLVRQRLRPGSLTHTSTESQAAVRRYVSLRMDLRRQRVDDAEAERQLAAAWEEAQVARSRQGVSAGHYDRRIGGMYLAMGWTRLAREAYRRSWAGGGPRLPIASGLLLSLLPPRLAAWTMGLHRARLNRSHPSMLTLHPSELAPADRSFLVP